MSGEIGITVDGLELGKKLEGFEQKLAKKVIKRAITKGAAVIRKAVRMKAPKKTGLLRRSVKAANTKRKRPGEFSRRVTTGAKVKSGKFSAFAGAAFYGGFIQYGWTPGKRKLSRFKKKRANRGFANPLMWARAIEARRRLSSSKRVKPNPFVTRGFRKSKHMAEREIMMYLQQGIEQEAKR